MGGKRRNRGAGKGAAASESESGKVKRRSRSRSVAPALEPVSHTPVSRALLAISLLLLAALGVALGYRQIASPDIGFHLSTARWIVERGWVPATDPFTYTVTDHPYIDLQWLFQLLTYGAQQLGGTALIVFGTTALTLGFAALLPVRAWRRNGRIGLSSLVLLLLFFLASHWETRPHMLSWLYGSIVLLALEEHARGSKRWLWALPVVMVLWINSHSLFVLGLVVIAIYAGCNLLHLAQRDRRLLVWSAGAVVACLINPYHIKGMLFPLVQFGDIQSASVYKSLETGISEYASPLGFDGYIVDGRFVLVQPQLYWHLFILFAVAGIIAGWRRMRPAEWLVCGAFFYTFCAANKNFGYFVMACFPPAAYGLERLGAALCNSLVGRRDGSEPVRWTARCCATALGAFAALCVGLIAATWSGRLYDMAWSAHRRGVGFNHAAVPVEACRFINDRGIEGRLLNSWNHGGYIAWSTRQPVLIYSHGEVMGQRFYEQYVESKTPEGFADALARWRPTVAVVPYKDASYWLYHLNRARDWRMAHADEVAAVFLHRSVAPHVAALPAPASGVDYPAFDDAKIARVVGRAVQARKPSFVDRLEGMGGYPMWELNRAGFYLHTNQVDACIGVSLAGLERTSYIVPDLLLTLGHALNARGEYEAADLCYDAFVRHDGDAQIGQQIAMMRRSRRGRH